MFRDRGFACFVAQGVWVDIPFGPFRNRRFNLQHLELQQSANGIANSPMRVDSASFRANLSPLFLSQNFIAIRNPDLDIPFQGRDNRLSCIVSRVSISTKATGIGPVPPSTPIVKVYCLDISQLVGPVWISLSVTSPIQAYVNPVYAQGAILPPRRTVGTMACTDGNSITTFSPSLVAKRSSMGTSSNSEDWILYPGAVMMMSIDQLAFFTYVVTFTIDFVTGL
jgi:hypothetical protein